MTSQKLHKFNPKVFYPTVAIIALVTLFSLIFKESASDNFKALQNAISDDFGWFYVLAVAIMVLSVLVLGFSRLGDIKLGLDHTQPKYKNISWFAMLFSAGMGIGLVFFGVAEPLMHYLAPPVGEPQSKEAARLALNITLFHWGLSAWAIYALVALMLAFFAYRHGLPLSLRSAFYPLIGDRIYGFIGSSVDTFAAVSTLFGIATSLGYGVLQVNAGLSHVFGIENSQDMNLLLLILLTSLATISASTGVDKGIKILSNTNIAIAVIFLMLVLSLGDTVVLLRDFVQNSGNYISTFITNTFNLYAYNKESQSWLGGWTLLYWAWWLSWSPFVGVFIARISKGRTIREFVVGVLLVPTGFTFAWMSVFGNSAIDMLAAGYSDLAQIVSQNSALSLFAFLDHMPFSNLLSLVATAMVVVFFVTSADSAAMVINMLTSDGRDDTPLWQKLFWSVAIGVVAVVLMRGGGLASLQAMTIASAFPLSIALVVAIFGLFRALRIDAIKKEAQNFAAMPLSDTSKSWQERLESIVELPDKKDAREYLRRVVTPALNEVAAEFNRLGLSANVIDDGSRVRLVVGLGDESDFSYAVGLAEHSSPDYASEIDEANEIYYRAEVFLKEGGQGYDVLGWSKSTLINDVIEQYRKHMQFLHILR